MPTLLSRKEVHARCRWNLGSPVLVYLGCIDLMHTVVVCPVTCDTRDRKLSASESDGLLITTHDPFIHLAGSSCCQHGAVPDDC